MRSQLSCPISRVICGSMANIRPERSEEQYCLDSQKLDPRAQGTTPTS